MVQTAHTPASPGRECCGRCGGAAKTAMRTYQQVGRRLACFSPTVEYLGHRSSRRRGETSMILTWQGLS